MVKYIENNPIATIILCVLIMLGTSFQFLDITIMEARNFITAREMVEDGNWLLTTMNGEPRYQKPPLPTWFAAVFGWLFGMDNILAIRFPGIIMLAVIGLTAWKFSLEFVNDAFHALINALITITSFYIVAIIIEGPWDIFAHGFMYLAIFQLYRLFNAEKTVWHYAFLAGLFIGCSMLCKGPVPLYALLLPFLIVYGLVFKYPLLKSKLFSLVSVFILALVIGGWWYLYVRLVDQETFLKITSKETGNWSSYNVRPFYYYWSFFTQSGIWTIPALASLLYWYLKPKVNLPKQYRLTFLWTILAVVLLSIIPEKKSRYLMPVLIPLALNTGFYITYIIRNHKALTKIESLSVYFNFGLIALIGIAFPFAGYLFLKDNDQISWIYFTITAVLLFAIGLLLLYKLAKSDMKQVFYSTIAFVVIAFALLSPFVPNLKPDNYKSLDSIKTIAKKENLQVYGLQSASPETIWLFGNKIKPLKSKISDFDFPEEHRFGLLVQPESEFDFDRISKAYDMEKVSRFDLNTVSTESKRHRKRLASDFYILTKK